MLYYDIEDSDNEIIGFSIVDISNDTGLNAILSIIRTIFVTFVLSGGALFISKDV